MLVEKNIDLNYCLYNFPYISENCKALIDDSIIAHERFQFNFPNQSSTYFYRYYNAVSLAGGSTYYWNLFKIITTVIREYANHNQPLWFQCWLNFHGNDSLLDWHQHRECKFHGYVSIDPKDTLTEFENFKIQNKIGNIYIGPADLKHRVVCVKPFISPRITLGFDVYDEESISKLYTKHGKIDVNIGMIPI